MSIPRRTGAESAAFTDPFGRRVDYLRISITDRCNERCLYCMPEGYQGWAQRPDHLSADEIIRTVEAATRLGFRRFRITGGEPLIRRDAVEICRRIVDLPGAHSLGVSTNGTRLASLAHALRQAGVHSLNVSLDALNPAVYHQITGGDVEHVIAGIDAALAEGFEVIKLNCVLLRGVNEDELLPLIRFAAGRGMPIRFIELMPLSRSDVLDKAKFLPVHEWMRRLSDHGSLTPAETYRPGHGPARYYEFKPSDGSAPAKVGFIGAVTDAHFCESCNKLRLTADGKLRPCLGQHGEIDLLPVVRGGSGDVDAVLMQAIANKPENHAFLDAYEPHRPMTAIGG